MWIFYYAFGDIISYEKKPRNGKATRHQLTINGKPVIGSHTELAAALWQDSVGQVSMPLWNPFLFHQNSFFSLSLWLIVKKWLSAFCVNCLLMRSFCVHHLISHASTILPPTWNFTKLLYKEPLATNGSTVLYPTTNGRLVQFLLSLPSAQGNSRENKASFSESFSMKSRTQDNSLRLPIPESTSGRRLPSRDYNSALVTDGDILGTTLFMADIKGMKVW